MREHKIPINFSESVLQLMDAKSSNFEQLEKLVNESGYALPGGILNTANNALPQRRRRA